MIWNPVVGRTKRYEGSGEHERILQGDTDHRRAEDLCEGNAGAAEGPADPAGGNYPGAHCDDMGLGRCGGDDLRWDDA